MEPKYPDFPTASRQEAHAYWTEKVGSIPFAHLIDAIGPHWRADKADVCRLAVRDYVGLITKGRSAPYVSPADLGKKLGALIGNVERHRQDAVSRMEGAEIIIHGVRTAA